MNTVSPGNRKVLLIDDDPDYLTILRMAIRGIDGVETATAASAEEGLDRLDGDAFDLVLTDLHLPGQTGIEFIRIARERGFRSPILVLTAHGSVDSTRDALKAGAADYLQKPVEPEHLRALVATLISNAPPIAKINPIDAYVSATNANAFEGMLGVSSQIRAVFADIEQAAVVPSPVLVVGETGTGKELVARAIHARSDRAHGPFVPVHTGAIPRELIASELFGHEKGSFTGAVTSADGKFDAAMRGTLFLDEIGTMDLAMQVALLRVLENFKFTRVGGRKERDADVRIVAATNRDLLEMVNEGTFREDLYYRLAVLTVKLPPLRERPDDIALIAQHYLGEFATRYRRTARRLAPGALERLYAHPWPGNVRELRNVMEQTAVFARGEEVQPEEVRLVDTHVVSATARAAHATPHAGVAPPAGPAVLGEASAAGPASGAHPTPGGPAAPPHAVGSSSPPPGGGAPAFLPRPPAPPLSAAMSAGSFADSIAPTEAPGLRRDGYAPPRPATPAAAPAPPSPIAPVAAVARSTLGAAAANHSDDALVLCFPIGTTVEEAEKQLILRTLDVIGGNKQKAARILKISRRCLYNKLAGYGISTSPVREDDDGEHHEEVADMPSAKA